MFGRYGSFTGGIDLPQEKEATLDAGIVPCPRLSRLRVPLAPLPGAPAQVQVARGQFVSRGERLAAGGDQPDIFAPLAGRVAGIAQVLLPDGADGWRAAPALELVELDDPQPVQTLPAHFDWAAATSEQLAQRLAGGGIVSLRPAPMRIEQWAAAVRARGVDTLIANGMENVPFVTAEHRLLAERGGEVVRGLAILARACGVRTTMLAVDRRRTDKYRRLVGPARQHGIAAVALDHKYPTGADVLLVRVLTRRQTPAGGDSLDVRVAVTDPGTCWAAFRHVACGQPVTGRVVTLGGSRLERPGNWFVPFGADAGELLAAAGKGDDGPALHGPGMTGRLLAPGAVVGPATSALLAPPLPPPRASTPCIRCGWCGDLCPARLHVAALNDDFELARPERALRRGVRACVGCGTCSYVCPAHLPLARRVRLLKEAVSP